MKPLTANLTRLLNRCPQWGEFRAGSVTCGPYPHPIGANNGLTALAKRGLLGCHWSAGNVFHMTEAGRAARVALAAPPQLVSRNGLMGQAIISE